MRIAEQNRLRQHAGCCSCGAIMKFVQRRPCPFCQGVADAGAGWRARSGRARLPVPLCSQTSPGSCTICSIIRSRPRRCCCRHEVRVWCSTHTQTQAAPSTSPPCPSASTPFASRTPGFDTVTEAVAVSFGQLSRLPRRACPSRPCMRPSTSPPRKRSPMAARSRRRCCWVSATSTPPRAQIAATRWR